MINNNYETFLVELSPPLPSVILVSAISHHFQTTAPAPVLSQHMTGREVRAGISSLPTSVPTLHCISEAAAFLSHGLLSLPELWDGFRPLVLLQGSYSIKYSIAFSSASHRTQSWTFFSLSTLLGQSHSCLQIQLQLEADDPKAVNCRLVLNPESSRPTLVYPLAY